MAGVVSFKITTIIKGANLLGERARRVKDLTIPFKKIISSWVANNAEKFFKSMGREESGVLMDEGLRWQALRPSTIKRKRAAGLPNWLMVETGSLGESLTSESRIFSFVEPDRTIFGMPLDFDDVDKIRFNWPNSIQAKRQAIFLDRLDRIAIEGEVSNWLNAADEAASLKSEAARMDAAFTGTVAG